MLFTLVICIKSLIEDVFRLPGKHIYSSKMEQQQYIQHMKTRVNFCTVMGDKDEIKILKYEKYKIILDVRYYK